MLRHIWADLTGVIAPYRKPVKNNTCVASQCRDGLRIRSSVNPLIHPVGDVRVDECTKPR